MSCPIEFSWEGGEAVKQLCPSASRALKVSTPNLPYLLLTIFPRAVCVPAEALVCRVPVTRTYSAALGQAECQSTVVKGKSVPAELEHSGTGVWCLEYAGFPARNKMHFSFLFCYCGLARVSPGS